MKTTWKMKLKAGVASVVTTSLVVVLMLSLMGCTPTATEQNTIDTKRVTETLLGNQATPTDIEFSLERFNLIKRAYWVNGMREKANAVPCPVERPIGYIACIDEGAIVFTSTVDGKVSSLNSYLSPDSSYYATSGMSQWLADVDGSYGENVDGVFWFTVDGHYKEWNGKYIYGDEPFQIDDPVLKVQYSSGETGF